MNRSIKRVTAIFAASSMLLALLCMTAARAQDANEDESGTAETTNTSKITQVTGTWTGTDTQAGSSPGPMMMVLTQTGKSVGGTFSVTTGKDTPAGNAMGSISKNNLKLTFVTTSGTNHTCKARVLATVDSDATPQTMSGTFLVIGDKKHCKGKGMFDLTQQ
jgi:hypothetical protein